MCNTMLPRSSNIGIRRQLCSCPRPAAVQLAAVGRTLHRSSVAAAASAPAQQQDANQPQPRKRRSRTRHSSNSSSSSSSAVANSTEKPVGPARKTSTPDSAPSSSSTSSDPKDPLPEPYSLETCTHLLSLHSAFLSHYCSSADSSSSTDSSTTEQQHQRAAAAVLQPHAKPGDYWLFVRCGSLLNSEPGPGSAAVAVLQLWQVGEGLGDCTLWRLDSSGLPTGAAFFSLTGES